MKSDGYFQDGAAESCRTNEPDQRLALKCGPNSPFEAKAEFSASPAPLVDPAKLDIRDGVIHYKIRQQDDTFVEMTVRDTPDMRRFVSWVQIHD